MAPQERRYVQRGAERKLMTQCLRGMYRHDSKVLNSTEDAYTVIFESTITPGATSFALDRFSSMLHRRQPR
jgi:hypothetical protein